MSPIFAFLQLLFSVQVVWGNVGNNRGLLESASKIRHHRVSMMRSLLHDTTHKRASIGNCQPICGDTSCAYRCANAADPQGTNKVLQYRLPPKAPPSYGTKNVYETIVIDKAGVYDFKSVKHIWKGEDHPCFENDENGPQILRVQADNVVVKNFHFVGDGVTDGSNGLGDPIHITSCGEDQGNECPTPGPRHVVLDGIKGHACEDLLTIGTPGSRNITIKNSYFKANQLVDNPHDEDEDMPESWDKTIQVNFGTGIKFINNIFFQGQRCIRLKPNTAAYISGNSFYGCREAINFSADGADVEPMEDGPVRVVATNNQFFGCIAPYKYSPKDHKGEVQLICHRDF